MKGFAGYNLAEDAPYPEMKALLDKQLARTDWPEIDGAVSWKISGQDNRIYLATHEKNTLHIFAVGTKKGQTTKCIVWGSSDVSLLEAIFMVENPKWTAETATLPPPRPSLNFFNYQVELGIAYYVRRGEVFCANADVVIPMEDDGIGPCLTCGALDGQPCNENCGKDEL